MKILPINETVMAKLTALVGEIESAPQSPLRDAALVIVSAIADEAREIQTETETPDCDDRCRHN